MGSTVIDMISHLALLRRHLEEGSPTGAIISLLIELGVPTNKLGFELLKYAIDLQSKNPTRALKNDIYLEIALHYQQNSESQVEQAIRDTIKKAWKDGKREAWEMYFSCGGSALKSKPPNREFISRMAYIVALLPNCR
jgi:hypothetical protein